LVLAPALNTIAGLSGLFVLTGLLAFGGVAVVIWGVPPEPAIRTVVPKGSLKEVLTHIPSLRNNLGVFVLHGVLLAMWVAVPQMMVDAGLPKEHHWWIYLPAVLFGFLVMGKTLFPLERKGYLRGVPKLCLGHCAGHVQLGLGVWRHAQPVVHRRYLVCFLFRLQHFGSLPA